MEKILQPIYQSILDGRNKDIVPQVEFALQAGFIPKRIMDAMTGAMAEVGRLFESGDYFIPDMLIAARAMHAGMGVLKPYLVETNVKSTCKVAIGTVKGDLHDIGKNLVAMMLEGAGMEVIDLGVDVPAEKFVETASQVDVIALSALLTTTMPNMKVVIEALKAAGKRGDVKIVVGGAPVTTAYAGQIGADGYASDASRAVTLIKSLSVRERDFQ